MSFLEPSFRYTQAICLCKIQNTISRVIPIPLTKTISNAFKSIATRAYISIEISTNDQFLTSRDVLQDFLHIVPKFCLMEGSSPTCDAYALIIFTTSSPIASLMLIIRSLFRDTSTTSAIYSWSTRISTLFLPLAFPEYQSL